VDRYISPEELIDVYSKAIFHKSPYDNSIFYKYLGFFGKSFASFETAFRKGGLIAAGSVFSLQNDRLPPPLCKAFIQIISI